MRAATAVMTTDARRPSRSRGVDRWSVVLFSLAAMLAVLALLASHLRSGGAGGANPRHVLVRQIIRTRVIETIVGDGRSGTSVSQSVSAPASGSASYASAPTTRASG